jgi:Amt family ammonium transporter
MVVPVYTADTSFVTQFIGFAAIGIFVFVVSLIAFTLMKGVIGIRVSEEAEINGLDVTELGMEAYPEFSKG